MNVFQLLKNDLLYNMYYIHINNDLWNISINWMNQIRWLISKWAKLFPGVFSELKKQLTTPAARNRGIRFVLVPEAPELFLEISL